METFTAFLDYFSLLQWKIIGVAGAVFFWGATKLTNRYFERKRQVARKNFENRMKAQGLTPPPDIPFPPE